MISNHDISISNKIQKVSMDNKSHNIEHRKKISIELENKEKENEEHEHEIIIENRLDDDKISINTIKKLKTEKKCEYCLQNIKEFLFITLLVGSNLTNFSILNLPYTVLGLIIMLFTLSTHSCIIKTKKLLVRFLIIYDILVLIFKFIFLAFYYTNYADNFTRNNKILLINLGLKFLQSNDVPKFINTFLLIV